MKFVGQTWLLWIFATQALFVCSLVVKAFADSVLPKQSGCFACGVSLDQI